MKLARRYACRYQGRDGVYGHSSGYGTPTRRSCARCKGPLDVQTGLWGVFTWTGSGRYPEADAHITSSRNNPLTANQAADRRNDADPGANWVVRWIPRET